MISEDDPIDGHEEDYNGRPSIPLIITNHGKLSQGRTSLPLIIINGGKLEAGSFLPS